MVTWYSLWKSAQAKAGISRADAALDNAQSALVAMSEMRQELQSFGNAVTRLLTISISSPSADGGFTLSDDVKLERECRLQLTGSSVQLPVTVVPPEEMDSIREDMISSGLASVPNTQFTQYFYTIENGKLWLYPFAGITGTLTLRYTPHMTPYEPSNPTGDWASATNDPFSWMQANGPEEQFWPAVGGMSSFLAAQLMESEGTVKTMGPRYERLMLEWQVAKNELLRNQRLMSKKTRPPHRNGVVR